MNQTSTNARRTTTMTSREFNQDTGRAKRAAADGPVIITDRGEPTHVLQTYEDFRKSTERPKTGFEALVPANQDEHDFDFDIPKMGKFGLKIPDFDE